MNIRTQLFAHLLRRYVKSRGLTIRCLGWNNPWCNPVLYGVPCTLLVGLLYLGSQLSEMRYLLAITTRTNFAFSVTWPVFAGLGALEMRPLRLFWGAWQLRRSRAVVVLDRLAPVMAGAVLTGAVLHGIASFHVGAASPDPFLPNPMLVGLALWGALAWVFAGAALGLVFPTPAAVPAALLLPFLFVTVPFAWEPVWLRHVTSNLSDCCSTSQVLDMRAAGASALMSGAVLLAGVLLIALRLGRAGRVPLLVALRVLAACSVVVGLVVASLEIVRGMGPLPVQPRSAEELRCDGPVCLWPQDYQPEVMAANIGAWSDVRQAWAELGLPVVPERISPIGGRGVLPLSVNTSHPSKVRLSMAERLPVAARGCANQSKTEYEAARTRALTILLLRRLGLSNERSAFDEQFAEPLLGAPPIQLWNELGPCGP